MRKIDYYQMCFVSSDFFKILVKSVANSMPKVNTRQLRRVRRRHPNKKSRPQCLCLRSLSTTLTEAGNIYSVVCKHDCKRPVFYFHKQCAQLYCNILRSCGYCKTKLIVKNIVNTNLLQTILKRRNFPTHG